MSKPSASKLYLKLQIKFLEYLKVILPEDRTNVTQYDSNAESKN